MPTRARRPARGGARLLGQHDFVNTTRNRKDYCARFRPACRWLRYLLAGGFGICRPMASVSAAAAEAAIYASVIWY